MCGAVRLWGTKSAISPFGRPMVLNWMPTTGGLTHCAISARISSTISLTMGMSRREIGIVRSVPLPVAMPKRITPPSAFAKAQTPLAMFRRSSPVRGVDSCLYSRKRPSGVRLLSIQLTSADRRIASYSCAGFVGVLNVGRTALSLPTDLRVPYRCSAWGVIIKSNIDTLHPNGVCPIQVEARDASY